MYDMYPEQWADTAPKEDTETVRKQMAAYYAGGVTLDETAEMGAM
jgi:hypothetical protein